MPSHAAEPASGTAAYPVKADAPVLGRWGQRMYRMMATGGLMATTSLLPMYLVKSRPAREVGRWRSMWHPERPSRWAPRRFSC